MNRDEWLRFYRCPTSVIFNRTPDGYDVLLALIQAGDIIEVGTDAGGHALFVDRRHASGASVSPYST